MSSSISIPIKNINIPLPKTEPSNLKFIIKYFKSNSENANSAAKILYNNKYIKYNEKINVCGYAMSSIEILIIATVKIKRLRKYVANFINVLTFISNVIAIYIIINNLYIKCIYFKL